MELFGHEDTQALRASEDLHFDLTARREEVSPRGGEGTRRRAYWAHRPGAYFTEAYWRRRLQACLDARDMNSSSMS